MFCANIFVLYPQLHLQITELVLNFAIKAEFKAAHNAETFNKEIPQKWNVR